MVGYPPNAAGGAQRERRRSRPGLFQEEVESHWSTVLCLLSPRPLEVGAGDVVQLTYKATFGDRVDLPTRYEVNGKLKRKL